MFYGILGEINIAFSLHNADSYLWGEFIFENSPWPLTNQAFGRTHRSRVLPSHALSLLSGEPLLAPSPKASYFSPLGRTVVHGFSLAKKYLGPWENAYPEILPDPWQIKLSGERTVQEFPLTGPSFAYHKRPVISGRAFFNVSNVSIVDIMLVLL